jgi:hypothetical protein
MDGGAKLVVNLFPAAPASSPATTSTERQQRQCRVYHRYLVQQWLALLILVQVTVLFPRFSEAPMSTREAAYSSHGPQTRIRCLDLCADRVSTTRPYEKTKTRRDAATRPYEKTQTAFRAAANSAGNCQ